MKQYLLPQTGTFYKANLHCHTTLSDGSQTPEDVKRDYLSKGYSVVAFTDHDLMLPHHDLTDESFLALTGLELEINEERDDVFQNIKSCHLCMIALQPDNVKQPCWHREGWYLFGNAPKYKHLVQFDETQPDYVRVYSGEGISDIIQKGRDAGFFVTYNHPTWSLESYPEYINYHGLHAMEICNYGCLVEGYDDYNPRVYDDMLRSGKRIYCIAADDNHWIGQSFGGFTMIKAERLDYRTITKALEDGHFYSSQGPKIYGLWVEDGEIFVECSPAAKIAFQFGNRVAHHVVGEHLTTAHATLPSDGIYVRITVTDHEGKPANTNAYFLDEILKSNKA